MFIVPILVILGIIVLILALIGGVVYAVINKNQKGETQNDDPTKKIRISEMISNFFNFTLLIINVVSIIMILFTIIDQIFKENIPNNFSDLHSSIALISISLPLSLALSYYIRKEHIKAFPKGNSPVKKFTISATVIASLIAICGSFFTIIYQYLEGETSSRFIAKIIVSLILSVVLFAYYRLIYVRGQSDSIKHQNAFGIISTVFIISICIYSIILTGSPSQIRKEKFDDIRLNNLSSIQQNILSYWQSHRLLPKDLASMTDAMSHTAIPKDPRNSEPYEYEIKTQSETVNKKTTTAIFKICATFETIKDNSKKFEELKAQDFSRYNSIKTNELNSYYPMDDSPFWDHKAEKTCFTRTIDPMVYQPQTEQSIQPFIK
jgi:amino acid transporter